MLSSKTDQFREGPPLVIASTGDMKRSFDKSEKLFRATKEGNGNGLSYSRLGICCQKGKNCWLRSAGMWGNSCSKCRGV